MSSKDNDIKKNPILNDHSIKYGDKIRLWTCSSYIKNSKFDENGGYTGYYEKNGRHGILNCVPPLGSSLDHLFREEEYIIKDPFNRIKNGEHLYYNQTIVLVNQYDMVWNNKTGGITGYIGPRPRNVPGEMFISFRKSSIHSIVSLNSTNSNYINDKNNINDLNQLENKNNNNTMEISPSKNSLNHSNIYTDKVYYGDNDIFIEVEESNRHRSHFNKRLSNFKKSTSNILGGYICSDGKGTLLKFAIHPLTPSIIKVIINKPNSHSFSTNSQNENEGIMNIGWNDPIHITKSHIKNNYAIEIHLSDGGFVFIKNNHIINLKSNEYIYIPIQNGSGGIILSVIKSHDTILTEKNLIEKENPKQISMIQSICNLFLRFISLATLSFIVLLLAIILSFLSSQQLISRLYIILITWVIWLPCLLLLIYGTNEKRNELSDRTDNINNNHLDGTSVSEFYMIISLEKWVMKESQYKKNVLLTKDINPNHFIIDNEGKDLIVPERFVRATKGNTTIALERYKKTLEWRKLQGMDEILKEKHILFTTIKKYYPHYYHKRGKNNEPVYYESPGGIDLKKLKAAGVSMDILLRHYAMITEYLWKYIEPNDLAKCITVIDVKGIGMWDFAGEVVDYVRKASAFTGQHYPERAATIYVLNVPSWFNIVWNVVKSMVDDITKEKIRFIKGEGDNIVKALMEKIPIENIPIQYGGKSEGKSIEELNLFKLIAFNNGEEGAIDPFLNNTTSMNENKEEKK